MWDLKRKIFLNNMAKGIPKEGVNKGWFKKGKPSAHRGVKATSKTIEKLRKSHLGQKAWNKGSGKATNNALAIWHKNYSKDKHPNWKGGITSINDSIRKSKDYKIWRQAVFIRDNFTCVWCGRVGKQLQADHIKPFAYFPELRFAIDNGRTLCINCHLKTDTWGRRALNFKK